MQTLYADVIVIGTGAGVAAVGAELAEAGHDVLFVEEGAYVADASLFPTAIGVNPQIGIMALATRVAERIIERNTLRIAA